MKLDSIDRVEEGLAKLGYLADRPLATAVYLAATLGKPLFLEGEPGVGKTEMALSMAKLVSGELIRLQCYEGLDQNAALYEWNYPKQLLTIRMLEGEACQSESLAPRIFGEEFLLERPLLAALRRSQAEPVVLLIDELDRADEEFEAFLLEFLDSYQISIPEVGTIKTKTPPLVVITSNRTREVHDALKRRCLYHWIDLPDYDKELAIVRARVPEASQELAAQVTAFMQKIREGEYLKRPGVSETLDWARALLTLGAHSLDSETVEATLGLIFKHQEDLVSFRAEIWDEDVSRTALLAGCGAC